MITALLAAFLGSVAAAAVHGTGAPAVVTPVRVSTAAVAALAPSTYTVSTLYTGDHYRDPFVAASAGGPRKPRASARAPVSADIHELQLRGIMKDSVSDFALFTAEDGSVFLLRGSRLYGAGNKRVPGITGRIRIKQKRAGLVTADKDVQIYNLGESSEADGGKSDHP